jgi:sugar lactone lactonase YvrE
VRRILLVGAVAALAFAAVSLFAFVQGPSAATAASAGGQTPGFYVQPQIGLQDIQSSKTAAIVANGISPRALAIDPRANVYLTDAAAPNRIFTLTGIAGLGAAGSLSLGFTARLAVVAGNGSVGSLGDGGNALGAQFNLKLDSLATRSGIAVASDGTIFVADTLNSTIRRIAGSDSEEPGVARSIAGRWASAQSLQVAEPLGLALDHSGNLYLADDASGAIELLPNAVGSTPGDQHAQVLAHAASPASISLTVDGSRLFVASPETGAVFEIDTQTRQIQPVAAFPARENMAGSGATSICAGSNTQGAGPDTVCPAGMAVDGAGNLFVADANSGRILRVDAKTSALTAVASGLRSPGDMRFDSNGNLYVAEQGANRILKFASMGASSSSLTITMPQALPVPPSPRVCPQTAPFNFCDQPVGGTTATQEFTLTNNASAAATGITISFTGSNPNDFQAPSNTCGMSLAAGASCTINVDFAPTVSGSRSANVSVTDSASDSAVASVTGTGDDYQIALNGSPQEQSVVQGGTITYNFNIVPDAVFGGNVSVVCPSSLPSLSTCAPSSTTVTVAPGTTASFSMTFQTTYNGVTGGLPTNGSLPGVIIRRDSNGPGATSSALWALGILSVGFAVLTFLWHRPRRPLIAEPLSANAAWLALFLLTACAFVFLAGCKHHAVPANLNTPAGTTNLTIQATAQNAGRGVTIILDVVGRG